MASARWRVSPTAGALSRCPWRSPAATRRTDPDRADAALDGVVPKRCGRVVHTACGWSDDKGVDKPREPASRAARDTLVNSSPHASGVAHAGLDPRNATCIGRLTRIALHASTRHVHSHATSRRRPHPRDGRRRPA
ncbi:hypothetical protein LUTEI9C_30096 [Luteimonas sp. 9C]|nr:hypothetical protein LUTEI9C_30096 [Luteimonas sp. 9C]